MRKMNDLDVATMLMVIGLVAVMGFPACSDVYNKNSADVVDRGTVVQIKRDMVSNYFITLDTSNTYHVDETTYRGLLVGDGVIVYSTWPEWEWMSFHKVTRIAA